MFIKDGFGDLVNFDHVRYIKTSETNVMGDHCICIKLIFLDNKIMIYDTFNTIEDRDKSFVELCNKLNT